MGEIFDAIINWHSGLKGASGEWFVSRKLNQLDSNHYRVLNDLLLPSSGNLDTTQIDHVVVSDYGIFCIETKDYNGWIFGNANQEYWTQVIYRVKNRFYNPLRQNYVHTKAIEGLIKQSYPNIPIVSFIAFPSAGKLKVSGTDSVGSTREIVNKIRTFNQSFISSRDVNNIYEILSRSNIKEARARRLHNQGARDLKSFNRF